MLRRNPNSFTPAHYATVAELPMIAPSPELFTLLYASTFAPRAVISDVADIARTSRRRNSEDGITGLLVFDGASFVQLVEGSHDPVAALCARLTEDRRHVDMDVLVFDYVDHARRFPDWDLGYHFADGEGDDLRAIRDLPVPAALERFEAIRARVDTLAGAAVPEP